MVSFDVESLFTSVPVKELLDIVKGMLRENQISENVIVLLRNCLEGSFFLYNGQHYLQLDGVAMGSPVAPVLANIWMEYIERKIDLQSAAVRVWKRYVDDVFCIMRADTCSVDNFLHHLNSLHENIKFTYELEKDRTLAFLDVKIMARPDGSLAHTVHRKSTHTDRYLNASSHHHPRHLKSVARSLYDRAYDLCDPDHLEAELQHVQEVLKRNGYKTSRRWRKRKNVSKRTDVKRQPAFLPYIKGVTDKVGALLKSYSIDTIFTPLSKLSKHLRTPKDVVPLQIPGVYKINCSCGSSYIGQTKRTIAERVKEHIAAVKNRQVEKSAIAEHLLESGPNHWIELHDPKIISVERHYYSRIVREAVEIKKHKNFNRGDGFKLSSSWNPVISKCSRNCIRQETPKDTVSVVCRQDSAAIENQERVVEETTCFSKC